MLKKLAFNNDCDVLYCEEGYFSPNNNTETTNPLLIRFICQKRKLAYYEKSENYSKYKHIIPKMRKGSLLSYDEMTRFNKILEKNNIKYTAVAGTSLGLERHGGIIPWDNDIDIGFAEKEWEALLEIKDELEKNGFRYKCFKYSHCHFGKIDCFQLKKKRDFYLGTCKTMCSVDEYNNVVKQIFGSTYIYAPFSNQKSLEKRYGKDYFYQGNVNDNFHFKDKCVEIFNLNDKDLSYQI